jgi:hypothetical protein
MINFRSDQILLIGDTHDLRRTHTIFQRKPNIDDFDSVFLGDGGEGFFGRETDEVYFKRINEECRKRNIRLFCLRGNHTNPEVWRRNYEFSNLFLVPDYTPATFPNGKMALLVGGGLSIDRFYRTEGLDYWKDEITVYQKTHQKFYYLFAHDCADYFNHSTESLKTSPYAPLLLNDPTLFRDALAQRRAIGDIVADIEPKYCFSGHFHNSIQEEKFGIKYRCLDIDEILLLDTTEA